MHYNYVVIDMENNELEACDLGTLEYWEERYQEDIINFKNHGDVGDIWFGEDILERLLCWIEKCSLISKTSSIVDVGCGNGILLVELSKKGFENLLGIDYSQSAISLAKEIAEKEALNINYQMSDVLEPGFYETAFDVVLDKGTYDAISLSPNAKENRNIYIETLYKSMKDNSLLILTSCNWTKEELDVHFNEKFDCYSVIPTPQFKFGGKIGSVVTCIVYKKK